MKKLVCFIVLLFLVVVVSGCENAHEINRQRAEEFAIRAVQANTFNHGHAVINTIYDEETGNFIVYVDAGTTTYDEETGFFSTHVDPENVGEIVRIVVTVREDGGYNWVNFDETFADR